MSDYRHLLKMTDDIGILQFSRLDEPDKNSGYTLDDNARALMVALNMGNGYELALKFSNYLYQAQRPNGSWSNLYLNGRYLSKYNSEDSIGRALLACSLGACCDWKDVQSLCVKMLKRNLPRVIAFGSPRAIAYTIIALCKLNQHSTIYENYSSILARLSEFLIALYQKNKSKNWMWFESYITYCNGILPQAMFSLYAVNGDKKALKTGHETLCFLNSILFRNTYLNIVGNQGWYNKGDKTIPFFDQQPVDAASIAFACYEAYDTIGRQDYLQMARMAYQWYRGKNIHGLPLYNDKTGGCFDALTKEGVNLNQGAEAVLSLILSDMLMAGSFHEEQEASSSS